MAGIIEYFETGEAGEALKLGVATGVGKTVLAVAATIDFLSDAKAKIKDAFDDSDSQYQHIRSEHYPE